MEKDYKKFVELFEKYGSFDNKDWHEIFYINDYPIPYKGLLLHPIKVRMFYLFKSFVDCLTMPHLTSGDVEAISRTYFEYLVFLIENRGKQFYLQSLFEILSLSLQQPIFNEDKTPNIFIKKIGNSHFLQVGNEMYDSNDFDNIRKIICEQNAVEMINEEIHPEVLNAYKELEEYKRKMSKFKVCNFEEQIAFVVAKTSYKKEECLDMTIRFFHKLFNRLDKIEAFEVYTPLAPNMDKQAQDSIEHYLAADKTQLEQMQAAQIDPGEVTKNFTSGVNKD